MVEANNDLDLTENDPHYRQLTPEEEFEETVDSIYVVLKFVKALKVDYGFRSLTMARAP